MSFLKDGSSEYDKNFRHLVKKSIFQLLDLPEADVLVVKISEEKQVRNKLIGINTFKL